MRNELNNDNTVTELTGVEGGVWQVFTAGSVHVEIEDVDYYWMITSTIARISQYVPTASDNQVQRGSGAEE